MVATGAGLVGIDYMDRWLSLCPYLATSSVCSADPAGDLATCAP